VPAGVARTVPLMGTVVTIDVVGHDSSDDAIVERDAAVNRAFDWCRLVEAHCSRFDPDSEISRLSGTVGVAVPVSELVFRALEFACALAVETDGAFDPTVGGALVAAGFDRNYQTGKAVPPRAGAEHATHRDIVLDAAARAVTLARPLQLDLGAVAKGLAVDLAARELQALANFAIDAGGDVYLAGQPAEDRPWTVGIRHPREAGALIGQVTVTNRAVCTSGDYERTNQAGAHHLIDPARGTVAQGVASVTVMAASAMVADGLGTAAFVLGSVTGAALLDRMGVDGLIVTPDLSLITTNGMQDAFLSYA
jgi:thiamine biosynthesis lipoprotein